MFGVGFARLRRIPPKPRTIVVGGSTPRAMVAIQKRDEATGSPEATALLPIAPHTLRDCHRVASPRCRELDVAADRRSALDDGPRRTVRVGQ